MPQTAFKHKAALLLFGWMAGILLLEIGLRTAGFVVLYFQERENRRALKERNEYVILCVGESTTVVGGSNSYPRQLEMIINDRNPGKKVAVINKGIVATNTTTIVSLLPEYLAEYRPDMVIAMMGINDELGIVGAGAAPPPGGFFRNLRVYKLSRLLWDRVAYNINLAKTPRQINKEPEDIIALAETAMPVAGMQKRQPPPDIAESAAESIETGDRHFEVDDFEATIPFYRAALQVAPGNTEIIKRLANCLREIGSFQEDREMLRQLLVLDPRNPDVYVELGNSFRDQQAWETAEVFYRKAIALNPNLARAYEEWGHAHKRQGDNESATPLFLKAIDLEPDNASNSWLFLDLAKYYNTLGKYDEAGRMYQKARDIKPLNNYTFHAVAAWYLREGKYEEVDKLCREILQINPHHDVALGLMAVSCQAQGKKDLEEIYFSQANELRAGLLNPKVTENYQKVLQMARERGIPLVCVQYPMRDVDHLQRMFPDPEGIIFVDNEAVFKKALEAGSYKDIFTDCFAGDFGHCTPRGNRILAGNIAEAIIPVIRREAGMGTAADR